MQVEVSAGVLYGLEGMELGGAILVSAAVATGPQQEIRAIPSEGIISVAAVDDPVEVDSSPDLPEATASGSTPPVTLGAADISPSKRQHHNLRDRGRNRTRRSRCHHSRVGQAVPKEVTPYASTWWAVREYTRAIV